MALFDFNQLQLSEVIGKKPKFKPDPLEKQGTAIASTDLVGVEIELEQWAATEAAEDKIRRKWQLHDEGSLVNGREFVLYPPLGGASLKSALDLFFDAECAYNPSERASVHVHVDMLNNVTVQQFRNLFALVFILEGAIYRIADENRKWASYSCPLIDMRVDRFNGLLMASTPHAFVTALTGKYHEEKYYGFNPVSLCKHGTVEFRYFPCTRNKAEVLKWVNMCLELKSTAMHFESTKKMCDELLTPDAVQEFVRKYMPKTAEAMMMYLDCEDCINRSMNVRAVLTDKHALKIVTGDDVYALQQSKSFDKMAAKVFRAAHEFRVKKVENRAVDVTMLDLYQNMLRQAKQRNYINNEENL